MKPIPGSKPALAFLLAVVAAACSENLPTQAESSDFEEPTPVAPVVRPVPLAFVEDALVMESVGQLRKEGPALMRSWDALRAELVHGDREEGLAAIRATRALLMELGKEGAESADPIPFQVLLLAVNDAEEALAAEGGR